MIGLEPITSTPKIDILPLNYIKKINLYTIYKIKKFNKKILLNPQPPYIYVTKNTLIT